MAPRSAKGKKAADVKLAENDAPKKGRGKAKAVEDPEPDIDNEDSEMVIVTDKKIKRGKKATNDANGQELNGKKEDTALPAKKGRKKNVDTAPEDKSNDDQSAEEGSVGTEETEQNDEDSESNGHPEEAQAPSGRGRKKQAKKETEKFDTKPSRGRKAKQDIDYEEKEVDEKPKTGRGRGRKPAPKVEDAESDKSETAEEEIKPDPPAPKGRKKAPAKAAKEKTPDSDNADEDLEEKAAEEPKKKESKGRKNQGKKAQAKEEADDDDEIKEEEPASKKRRINKKEDKVKEIKEDDAAEDEVPESKPAKGRRGQKKVDLQVENDDEPQDTGEPTTKRRRKAAEEKASSEDTEKKAPLKNKSATDYKELDFSNNSTSTQGKDWNFKIASWNVDGIRAWMAKGGLDYIKHEKPDILCLQEVKCAQDKLPDEVANLAGYHAYWLCSEKDGYAGVGIYTTQLAMNVQYGLQNEELDTDGRIITAEYEQFYLICTYVPNAGRKLVTLPKRLQWNEEFRKHVKELDKKKPVIICGDMNVSHNEIDLANPKTNRKNAGFTDEERSGMTDLLGDGFVDTYRQLNPDKIGSYTFWTYMKNSRSKNVGWRLDYFIVSERLLPSLCDNVIRDKVYGSDHCPITLFLHLSSADKPKE